MNYLMVKRELETLGKDLAQMAEDIIGPEPPGSTPGEPMIAKSKEGIKKEIDYVSAKLEAVSLLVESMSSQVR